MAQWIGIIFGIISGIAGVVLGIVNYLRDNPKLAISLVWDLEPFGNVPLDKGQLYGVIQITNTGRRPVFISHVTIRIHNNNELLITDSIQGEKLAEGDQPKIYPVTQEGLEEFSKFWDKMHAVVRDSAGREYSSSPPKNKPSWAHVNLTKQRKNH